jgi:antitoxin component of RelBE/YafQ-DinJ toxin-antitoxin module
LIEASGVFDILRDNEPNETTIEAINELKNGGGFTANGLDDLFKQLQS